jgi:transcriptional regulator EpsA
MRAERPELLLVDPPKLVQHPQPASDRRPEPTGLASLDGRYCESLLVNLDQSLRVYARTHLFAWTQGLLQSLIRHKVLICALRNGKATSFRVDSFSTLVPDGQIFGELLLRDAAAAATLTKTWKQRSFLPVTCETSELGSLLGGAFVGELKRVNATELLVHGTHDVGAEVRSLFVFACQPGTVGARETYFAQIIAPLLEAAWVRSQYTGEDVCVAPVGQGILTKRERQILRWIYAGKSNGEIGVILGISPLTVKNHVQKILRKLNVVNRAQAVGKALDARIISP